MYNKIIYNDDNLSKLSIMLGISSIIFFLTSIILNLSNKNLLNLAGIIGFFAILLSLVGYIVVVIAYKNENENIGRCLRAKRLNVVLLIFFVAIYTLNLI